MCDLPLMWMMLLHLCIIFSVEVLFKHLSMINNTHIILSDRKLQQKHFLTLPVDQVSHA